MRNLNKYYDIYLKITMRHVAGDRPEKLKKFQNLLLKFYFFIETFLKLVFFKEIFLIPRLNSGHCSNWQIWKIFAISSIFL